VGRYCIVDIRAWEGAGELEVGDHIWSISGEWSRVEAVSVSHDPQLMYNLTVDDAHTFFVGEQAWLVHNTCIVGILHGPRQPTGLDSLGGTRSRGGATSTRENDVADILVSKGNDVIQNPTRDQILDVGLNPNKNPDYVINGSAYDLYSPTGNNAWNAIDVGATKTSGNQAFNVIIDIEGAEFGFQDVIELITPEYVNSDLYPFLQNLIVFDGYDFHLVYTRPNP
jgi:hypothetical protein